MAVVSVTQNTPSNSTPRAARPRTASAPACMLSTSQFTDKVGGERNLRPTKCLTVALEPQAGHVHLTREGTFAR